MTTQINIYAVLIILLIHWIADFVLQNDDMAQGKSKNNAWLLAHTCLYSFVWIIAGGVVIVTKMTLANQKYCDKNCAHFDAPKVFLFALITLIFHTVQDYITSRINSRLWAEKKVHLFFVSIGFDQLLHFIQLIVTYQLLIKW